MKDLLLEKMFEPSRWDYAIEVAVEKGISKADLELLTNPKARAVLYTAIKNGEYVITPPRQQKIPKDNGDFRIVYINSNIDRIFLSIANDLLFELCGDMVHKSCKSYQKGLSCSKTVKEVAGAIRGIDNNVLGLKADLSKYFDSVVIEYIDRLFDKVEEKVGKSKVIDVLRAYYHCDVCFGIDGQPMVKYQSLKQGCAVASWLADAMLYDIDDYFTNNVAYYVRYSDDLLIIDENTDDNYSKLAEMLSKYGLKLNPKKVEILSKDRYFKFLGFSIKGQNITLSQSRIKTFYEEIAKRTIKNPKANLHSATESVMNYLYGNKKSQFEYCWATSVLTTINVDRDIQVLNSFVMDCLRAVATKKTKIGGLGYEINKKSDGVISRGVGKNVKSNRERTDSHINEYITLATAKNAMCISRDVFNSLRLSA